MVLGRCGRRLLGRGNVLVQTLRSLLLGSLAASARVGVDLRAGEILRHDVDSAVGMAAVLRLCLPMAGTSASPQTTGKQQTSLRQDTPRHLVPETCATSRGTANRLLTEVQSCCVIALACLTHNLKLTSYYLTRRKCFVSCGLSEIFPRRRRVNRSPWPGSSHAPESARR